MSISENTQTYQTKLIEVAKLTRHYDALCAVNDISFELCKGEILGFLGPNGAGKSTTMQMLSGTLAPSQGSITINGIDLLDSPLAAKQHIGFLPEHPPLYTELSVDEYLRFCAKLRRVAKDKLTVAIDNAKQRCGLGDVGPRLIGNLSKGYQQRVGIAQAILHNPPVVILDEPTVGLDPIQIREIRKLIKTLGQDHGVILSTHILPEVQMTCNRVQIINQGRLVFNDNINQLNQHSHTNSLLIRLQRPPAHSELEKIHGIIQVEQISDQRVRIHYEQDSNPTDELVQLSVADHWGLSELTPEARSLESIFMELTSGDNSQEDAQT